MPWVAAKLYLGTLGTPPDIMALDLDDVSDVKESREHSESPRSDMSMMRIAVAGTGGLARLIAHYIKEETSHHVVFLSRAVRLPSRLFNIASPRGSHVDPDERRPRSLLP